MESLYTDDQIIIKSDAANIWDLLTNPEHTVKYMYDCRVDTDWTPGSQILWTGATDQVTYVKGKIVRIEPESLLEYTVIDPNGKYPDVPENYLHVIYELSKMDDGQTLFRVRQGDYRKVAEGPARYEDATAQGGWYSILEQIKNLAEGSTT